MDGEDVETGDTASTLRSPGALMGRSAFDAPEIDPIVHLGSPEGVEVGTLVSARVTAASGYDLIAELVGAERRGRLFPPRAAGVAPATAPHITPRSGARRAAKKPPRRLPVARGSAADERGAV